MSVNSKIEWTDATWNPVTGCTKVSEGCRNCYALKFAERWRGTPGHYFENGFDIQLRPKKLDDPFLWPRPKKIFVNSMSDLFHEQVPFEFIASVWRVMAAAHWHTFQVLTKRPRRMLEFTQWMAGQDDISAAEWPRNVWLGVSVENQKAADERIPLLLQTPAAVRFLSCEPLLGEVDISNWLFIDERGDALEKPYIDWVIAGGESGPGARPVHPDWIRSLRDQCQAAGVSFHFKQWGAWQPMFEQPWEKEPRGNCQIINHEGGQGYHGSGAMWTKRVGKEKAGRELDGRTWDEFPEVR